MSEVKPEGQVAEPWWHDDKDEKLDDRTIATRAKVRQMMREIEAEVEGNEGIYPQNKGALNLRELARRTELHWTTLHRKNHNTFLANVKLWLKQLEREATIGRLNVRRTLTERVSDWKELCAAFADAARVSELDRQQAESEKETLQGELRQARGERDSMYRMLQATKVENEDLRRKLEAATGAKVVHLPPSGRRGSAHRTSHPD